VHHDIGMGYRKGTAGVLGKLIEHMRSIYMLCRVTDSVLWWAEARNVWFRLS